MKTSRQIVAALKANLARIDKTNTMDYPWPAAEYMAYKTLLAWILGKEKKGKKR